MDKKISCNDCLNYINGYDTKKVCDIDGKVTKVSFPTDPPCKNTGYRAKINLNSNICKNCTYFSTQHEKDICQAIVEVITGKPKTCVDARATDCGEIGKYYRPCK